MILASDERDRSTSPGAIRWPGAPLDETAFCSLRATGSDPSADTLLEVRAIRSATQRFERPGEPLEATWRELEAFLGTAPVIVEDLAEFESWRRHAGGKAASAATRAPAIGIAEIEALFGSPAPAALRSPGDPEALRERARAIVLRFLAGPPEVTELAALGYRRAWLGLQAGSPRAADILALAWALADRPSAWIGSADPTLPAVAEGILARAKGRLEDLLDVLSPGCERDAKRWEAFETVPVECDLPAPLADEDRERLDAIFREQLPASFAAGYRAGQHDVARAVADVLGSGELLLVHAPTGTGKTLAYLVPALIWASRHGTRIGVATYTRALQQQAMDREMPRALDALVKAGVVPIPRVAMLKGRENYVCWRALKLAMPTEEDGGEAWLAWTSLALFSIRDPEGDLDRFPLRPPLPLERSGPWRRSLADLLRTARGRSACCTHEADKHACAAELARKRAERSHLVITNQAFVLARQDFFKHVVFDECEHLHEQAHSAWSHAITFRQMGSALARLHVPRRAASPAILDRMRRATLEGTPTSRSLEAALESWRDVDDGLRRLEASLEGFEAWRDEESRARSERENHSLLREYVERDESAGIVAAKHDVARGLNSLDAALAEISERLDDTPLRGLRSLRRSLDLARSELAGMLEAVDAWLPLSGGRPAYLPSFFYDLESALFDSRGPRGERAISARVLLPNEVLGRDYYPQLATGVFVSATTWLRGGFESALGFLGLDRAADPAPDEDRPPRVVRTVRAPEVFDYSRVLVAVPRDAPPIGRDKEAYLDYVRRFVGHLGERTRGRMLVLFTNATDVRRVGEELAGFFRARSIGLLFQNMESASKEELSDLFRSRVDSVLLGVDTFWFGADFPGETLEYLVIVRLPYGVPDRYHHAQCAALGTNEQWRRIYLPRALAKFRQGFGRLMRQETDRGCVFVLDGRALVPKHRAFLRELPIGSEVDAGWIDAETSGARLVRGETDRCLREAFEHMGLLADLRHRGLDAGFGGESAGEVHETEPGEVPEA